MESGDPQVVELTGPTGSCKTTLFGQHYGRIRHRVFCMSGWEIRALVAGHKTWATRRMYQAGFGVWYKPKKPFQVGDVALVGEVYARRYGPSLDLMHYKATNQTYSWDPWSQKVTERFRAPTKLELRQAGGWRHPGSITLAEARWHIQITQIKVARLCDLGDLDALNEGYEGHPSQLVTGTMKESGKPPRTGQWIDGSPYEGWLMDRRDRSQRNEGFDHMIQYKFDIVKGPA